MNSTVARAPRGLLVVLLTGALGCSPGPGPEPTTDAASRRDAAAALDVPADRAASDVARVDAPGLPLDTGSSVDVPAPPRDVPPADVSRADPYNAARDACVAEINRYRAMLSLPPYMRWREGEACADGHAVNDAMVGRAHDGFSRRICSPGGSAQNECPRYGGPDRLNGCLAQMWAEGPSPGGVWDVAHGHYLNMVGDYVYMGFRQRFTRVACGFSAGGWMVQNFQ